MFSPVKTIGRALGARIFIVCALTIAASAASAQWLDWPTPGIARTADGAPDLSAPAPRTSWGTPDLSGIWTAVGESGDLPDSDKFRPWVVELKEQRASNFYADQPRYNCLPSGPAYLTATSFSTGLRRIVQTPDMITILHEDMVHRQIFMDGRELEAEPLLPAWMGYSVGYWDGDTLVVETNGYTNRTWLDRRGAAHTENLTTVERYRRTSLGTMELDVTYNDPEAFFEPLEVQIELAFQPDDDMLEYVCNETAQLGQNWEGSMEAAAVEAVEVPEAILQTYVGRYEGEWLGRPITLDFTVEDGELKLIRNNIEVLLVPRSNTAFDGSNGFGFVFMQDEQGNVIAVEEVHVSGGWPFPRVE